MVPVPPPTPPVTPAHIDPTSLRWCYTVNNPLLNRIPTHERMSYHVHQLEVGAMGTSHFQGYFEVTGNRVRRSTISRWPGLQGAHLEVARSTAAENTAYCTKDDGRIDGPWIDGAARLPPPGRGARTDLEEVMASIRDGANDLQLFVSHPSVMANHHRFVTTFRSEYLASLVVRAPLVPRVGTWQTGLWNQLDMPVDPRKIIWLWSTAGNIGKSHFANHYRPNTTAVINGGRHADIYCVLEPIITSLRTVFFDFAKSTENYPYQCMEQLKNGVFTNSKYISRQVRFNPVHVVVFANSPPDMNAMSVDRWAVTQIV